MVQVSVWADGKWINVNDTLDQANLQIDLNKVAKAVDAQVVKIADARSNANAAVSQAESAVSASKVNSEAIAAQSEAISEAKSAISSATAAIQQTAATAASDAAKIRADVAQVQSEVDTAKAANSASVEALKSDVSAAKQDLADVHDSLTKAQAAAEESQKAIDKSIDQINSDIEQGRKDIASAQQANADTAKQLDTYSKQAQDQGKTIKSIQDKQDGFTATLADVQGNVTQVSDKVDGLSASLKDAQDNVASVKAQSDQLSATLTDHAKSIATLTASAKELSSTLEDADGRLSKVEQTAQTNSSTLSDVQGDLSQVKQDATTLTATLKDAQGNISTLQQKADSVSSQLASAQGDIASLQTDVTGIKATLVSHEGDIHTLQADSKSLHDSMQDAQGDISTLKKTSTDVTSELKDHAGRISKTEQTASALVNEFADQQGHLNRVEQTANGTQQTVVNQQGQINTIKTDAAGIHQALTGQGNQIANINVTLSGLNTKYEGVSGDLNNLKSQAQWATVTSAVDLNNFKTPCHEFLKGHVTNAPSESAWWYLTVEGSEGNRIIQTVIADQSNNRYTRRWADGWSAWVKDATQTDVTALSNRITTNSTQITQNKKEIDLKADQSTVDNLSGEVSQNKAQLKVQAGQISSKVSSEDFSALNDRAMQNRGTVNGPDFNTLMQAGYYTVTNTSGGKNYPTGSWGTLEVSGQTSDSNGRLNQKYVSDNNADTYVRQYNANTKSWTAWIKTANQNDINTLNGKITKNSTAIDQTNKQISLKADQTEVNQVKQTATQNSSRLDVMAGQISSKVTSADVNNIVDKKGYATTGTVQSLITQKAGTINESIVKLDQSVKTGAENNVQLVRKSDFEDGDKGGWDAQTVVATDPPAELGQSGMKVLQTNARDAYESDIWYSVKPGEKFDVDFWCKPSPTYDSRFGLNFADKNKGNSNWIGVYVNKSDHQWKHYTGTITAPSNATFARPWFQMNKDASNTTDTALLAKPSIRRQNATTTAAIQQITASIGGIQSTVANKADKSQITQLSNVIQSKVSTNDFNNLRKAVDLQTLESADANNLKTNGHYFVHNLANNPVGGWVYVDVTGNGNDRIRQDVYQDSGNKHKYRRWFGNSWTNWSEGATESEITQLRDDINLRVKSGDLLSQINLQAGHTLIQSGKIYLDAKSVVFGKDSKAFIPAALITNLTADQITTGTLKSIQIDNGDGKFTVNSNGDVVANSIKLKNGQFLQGTIAGSTIYALNNDGVQDPKLAPKSDWYKITPNMIRWFNHYDQSVGQIGVGQGVIGSSEFTGTPGLTISDSAKILLGTAQRIVNNGDEIGNLETTGLDWMSRTNLEIDVDRLQVNLDPNYGTKYDGKGAEFDIQKDNKVGAYFGRGDHGNVIYLVTAGDGGNVDVQSNLTVHGSKNAVVPTTQGTVAINAYETAEYYFGDIGEDQTNGDGKVWVSIDYLFGQTVNTNVPYQVFVTPYSSAHVWVSKRLKNRFLVESDKPNASFAWEIKAKRKGYEHTRLKNVDNMMEKPAGVK